MSTSCEAVAIAEVESVWDFQYPMIAPAEFPSAQEASQGEQEIRLQRARSAALEAARRQGMREGEQRAAAAMDQKLDQERQAIAQAMAQFARERRSYFRRVEADVVTLSLAIARKLLHREAQIDPLLLSGVVRVALEQIQAGSQVVLRTSPSQQEAWQKFLDRLPESPCEVTVSADEAVEPGRLLLETTAGRVEFGLEEKLKEIESGFLDLLHCEEPDESAADQLS